MAITTCICSVTIHSRCLKSQPCSGVAPTPASFPPLSPCNYCPRQSMSSNRSIPPSFFKDELRNALEEQSFGINGFALTNWNNLEARAQVTLLENLTVDIVLSIRGFYVPSGQNEQHLPDTVFETVDSLLQNISPGYSAKLAETIVARLSSERNCS
ncbi:hypothetical protein BD410DRAFT_723401 [Rickenella mellea]|uniref:GSKIP domain-containing protein n=1 Tax=Rickenella mellea TaxID=50990 RepID=A0A4Y7Q4E4_9AGAM|nr:hypothetical protein BD410DRAFT_723401 [Rickenella mellea]